MAIAEITAALIYIPIHLLRSLGVRGLLENDGHCGSGWCAPTVGGIVCAVLFWLMVLAVVIGVIRTAVVCIKTNSRKRH